MLESMRFESIVDTPRRLRISESALEHGALCVRTDT